MKVGKTKITTPNDNCQFNECDGSGWIWWKDWRLRHEPVMDEWKEPCKCLKQKEIQSKIHYSHVPENFRDATINNFDVCIYKKQESQEIAKLAKTAAKNFVWFFSEMQKQGKGLYFYSRMKGSGKTRLISSISNAINSRHSEVKSIYIQTDLLLKSMQRTWGNKNTSVTSHDVMEMYMDADLLILDDLGVEMLEDKSGWIERTMTTLVNSRMESKKITIFSSNYRISELDSIYRQGRIQSRVEEMAVEIEMPEECIRSDKAKKENEDLEHLLFQGK
ncbi:DnaA ATPase domain-containing protein [Evansella clarkii]|uniref:DnaA ATPase domain-containing protein n=1 Tax=Evansella clarkii TaxID=79879 RepID=UPI001ADBEF99|nr:DnaA/Hda family protein [Evansella clarkii]